MIGLIFICKAVNSKGKSVQEEIDADSRKEAYRIMVNRKWVPVSIEKKIQKEKVERKKITEIVDEKYGSKEIKPKELIFLFYNISTMLDSGLSIDKALEISSKQVKREKSKRIVKKMVEEIKKGSSLSECIKETEAFPALVAPVIRSGEESGDLKKSFSYLSDYFAKQEKNKGKVVSALIYPVLVLIAVAVALYIMSIKVLPQIISVIQDGGGNVGIATKIIIHISHFYQKFGIWSLVIIFGVPIILYLLARKLDKSKFDDILIKLPVIGDLIKQSNTVQFTTTLYILLSSNITLNRALEIANDVVMNNKVKSEIENIRRGILKGETMSSRMNQEIFGEVICSIIKIGEESGQLVEPLFKSTEFVSGKLEETTKRLTELLVPFTMVIIALIVGVVVVGTLSPIMSMYK